MNVQTTPLLKRTVRTMPNTVVIGSYNNKLASYSSLAARRMVDEKLTAGGRTKSVTTRACVTIDHPPARIQTTDDHAT